MPENTLYFGDNLRDETVDLIYLHPARGSSPTVREGLSQEANYNVLVHSPKGHNSHAQKTHGTTVNKPKLGNMGSSICIYRLRIDGKRNSECEARKNNSLWRAQRAWGNN